MPSLSESSPGDSLFAPSWIVFRHLPYQLGDILRQRRTAGMARLPSPEDFESRAMPFEEGLRFDDGQRVPPIEEPGQRDHRQADRRGNPSWFHFKFLKQSQLPAEEMILGEQGSSGWRTTVEGRRAIRILKRAIGILAAGS
jgi:hypothetical protein